MSKMYSTIERFLWTNELKLSWGQAFLFELVAAWNLSSWRRLGRGSEEDLFGDASDGES